VGIAAKLTSRNQANVSQWLLTRVGSSIRVTVGRTVLTNCDSRQLNGERCAARSVVASSGYHDCAAVPIDDFLGDPQAKSSSNILLGRKEWLEDSFPVFNGDAGPVIADEYLDSGAA